MKNFFLVIATLISLISCRQVPVDQKLSPVATTPFDPATLVIKEADSSMLLTGEVLYLPVYSNIPHQIDAESFDMSAFVAVHNTDMQHNISVTRALYFNNEGELVHDFMPEGPALLKPFATIDFNVPYEDTSGLGANFIIEWTAEVPVSQPLIESVTISLKPNQSVAVLSTGRVVRNRR